MKHLFTLFLVVYCSSLTAQLKLPISWKSDYRITRQYRLDTANYNSLPDTIRFYPAIPIVLDSTYFTIGIDLFRVKTVKWPFDPDLKGTVSVSDPVFVQVVCTNGVLATFWSDYMTIQYPAKNNWWKTVEIHLVK